MKKRFSITAPFVYGILVFVAMVVFGVASVLGLIWNGQLGAMLTDTDRESVLCDAMPARDFCLIPVRLMNRILGRRYFPSENYYMADNGQLLPGSTAQIDPAEYAENLAMLQAECEAEGKNFLYVLCPGKPMSDEDVREYGVSCFRNENADRLIAELEERNVPCLDLRPLLKERSGGDLYRWFYKSDHHWTADAGMEAARLIAGELNRRYSCGLDEQMLSPENMTRTMVDQEWVGEMGQKTLGIFGPHEDHMVVWEPRVSCSFHMTDPQRRMDQDGGFELFFYKEILTENSVLRKGSLYYYFMQGNASLVQIDNRLLANGNLFVIKDSFSNVVIPYLSLTSAHVTTWDMRESKEVKTYLRAHPEIQTVMVMYTTSFSVKREMNSFQ